MSDRLQEALGRLPDLLAAHTFLALTALAMGVLIALPLGVLVTRMDALRGPATAVAGAVQTIPSLALLALMVPLMGGRIGFWPAFVALALYSMLPVLRNTIVGITGVDPAVREAARATGMTDRQSLLRVELPLAAPVILAGVRTAAVWVIGTATLATPVGARSLGNFIFSGLQTRNWTSVLVGCFAAAGLALAVDQILRGFEVAARRRDQRIAVFGALALAPVLFAAAWPALSAIASPDVAPGHAITDAAGRTTPQTLNGVELRVGAKTFTEQFILARVVAARLERAGAQVELVENLGSTIVFDALRENEIDVYVDYSGTLWATVLREPEPIARAPMLAETTGRMWEDYGVLVLGGLGFENAYAFAMRADRAIELGVRAIGDLAPHARDITKGGDSEFFGRPEWTRTRDAYGLQALNTRAMDSTFMYAAVRDGQVDVITAYTTDGRIDAFDLVLLDDPLGALPPYDAIVLLSPQAAERPAIAAALAPLLNRVTPELMRAANARVDLDGETPAAAAAWLDGQLTD